MTEMDREILKERRPERLALLVGSNPLPNYIAAKLLKPEKLVFVYSPETEKPYQRLREALGGVGEPICIQDATDAREIADKCGRLGVDHLHYSGGTKVMAAHARLACRLSEKQASYLDERKEGGLLRFDDHTEVPLDRCSNLIGLALERILQLHGITRQAKSGRPGLPSDRDAEIVWTAVLKRPDLAEELYGKHNRKFSAAKGEPWSAPEELEGLTAAKIPGEAWKGEQYKAWADFLKGQWLEHRAAALIGKVIGGLHEVAVSVDCVREDETNFEIDVALVRNNRLYVASCTIDSRRSLCKGKLFEVAMRAHQMGGDLARSALICLADKDKDGNNVVDQLKGDIEGLLEGAPETPKVFGLSHLREWAGTNSAVNLHSLQEWLNS